MAETIYTKTITPSVAGFSGTQSIQLARVGQVVQMTISMVGQFAAADTWYTLESGANMAGYRPAFHAYDTTGNYAWQSASATCAWQESYGHSRVRVFDSGNICMADSKGQYTEHLITLCYVTNDGTPT